MDLSNDLAQLPEVQIFPNPSVGAFIIDWKTVDYKNKSCRIVDVNGRVLLGKNITHLEISVDVKQFAKRNYWIQFFDGNTLLGGRLIQIQ